GSARSEGYYPI
nr:Chain B, Histone-lysine N-methyltransferase SETD1A [Homo sapiens]3UVN_D Chain D, Histone-lysine N-methyltransferase SETD1A [Homo sapiens]